MLPTLPRYILLLFVRGRRHCILDVLDVCSVSVVAHASIPCRRSVFIVVCVCVSYFVRAAHVCVCVVVYVCFCVSRRLRHCILDVCQCQCRRPCQYSVSSFSIQCRLCLRQLLRLRCPRLRLRLRLRLLLRHPSPASVLKPGATPCTPAGFLRFLSHRVGPM